VCCTTVKAKLHISICQVIAGLLSLSQDALNIHSVDTDDQLIIYWKKFELLVKIVFYSSLGFLFFFVV